MHARPLEGQPMSLLDEIKSRVTIEDVLAEQGMHLKRGRCICPLHGGDNPTSLSVKNGVFHCFACGESGDVITLVQKLHGLDFKEAVGYLTRKACIPEGKLDGTIRHRRIITRKRTASELETDVLDLWIRAWEKELKKLDRDMRDGRIGLPEFYAKRQWAEYQLSILDEKAIYENYQRNRGRKDG